MNKAHPIKWFSTFKNIFRVPTKIMDADKLVWILIVLSFSVAGLFFIKAISTPSISDTKLVSTIMPVAHERLIFSAQGTIILFLTFLFILLYQHKPKNKIPCKTQFTLGIALLLCGRLAVPPITRIIEGDSLFLEPLLNFTFVFSTLVGLYAIFFSLKERYREWVKFLKVLFIVLILMISSYVYGINSAKDENSWIVSGYGGERYRVWCNEWHDEHTSYVYRQYIVKSMSDPRRCEIGVDEYNTYEWIKNNTSKESVILAWWDYGLAVEAIAARKSVITRPSPKLLPTIGEIPIWDSTSQIKEYFTRTIITRYFADSNWLESEEKIRDVARVLLSTNLSKDWEIIAKYNVDYILINERDQYIIYAMVLAMTGDTVLTNEYIYENGSLTAKGKETIIGRAINNTLPNALEIIYRDESAILIKIRK
ncbi:MAG: hypothetical protein AB1779_08670 [Candidatus Thermoplasmatota archaeon]